MKLTSEDSKALRVDAAIGMLVTDDEIMAKRALNFLKGRFSIRDLGWCYKEGYYTVYIIGKPADFSFGDTEMGEKYCHQLKQLLDTNIHTDLQHTRMVALEVFQEVSL
jgi:hypothetical protein